MTLVCLPKVVVVAGICVTMWWWLTQTQSDVYLCSYRVSYLHAARVGLDLKASGLGIYVKIDVSG